MCVFKSRAARVSHLVLLSPRRSAHPPTQQSLGRVLLVERDGAVCGGGDGDGGGRRFVKSVHLKAGESTHTHKLTPQYTCHSFIRARPNCVPRVTSSFVRF